MSETKHHIHETAPLHDPVDPWHDHARDERPQQAHAEVQNTPVIMGVGVGLFLVIAFSVLAIYGFYIWYVTRTLSQQEITTAGAPALEWRAKKSESLALIQNGGVMKLPPLEEGKPEREVRILKLDEAMAKVIDEYRPKTGVAQKD